MPRKATDLSINTDLLEKARRLQINLSRAAQDGVAKAVSEARAAKWKQENADAIASSTDWIDRNGLPLAGYRNVRWRDLAPLPRGN